MEENFEGIKSRVVFFRASDVQMTDREDGGVNIEATGDPLGELTGIGEEKSDSEKAFCQSFDCSWYPSEGEYYTIRRLLYMRRNFVRTVYRMRYVNHHKPFPCLTLSNLRNDPKGIHELGGINYILALRRLYVSHHRMVKCRNR